MVEIVPELISGFANNKNEKKKAANVAPACVSRVSSESIDNIQMTKKEKKNTGSRRFSFPFSLFPFRSSLRGRFTRAAWRAAY